MNCPSTPNGTRTFQRTVTTPAVGGSSRTVTIATGDYAPNNAYDDGLEAPIPYVDIAPDRTGLLYPNKTWSVPEVRDGTSNTIALSECAGRPDRWEAGKKNPTTQQPDGGWADHDNEYIVHGFTWDGTSSPGPCHTNCTNNNEVYSFHSGGANHVFADGSVHFIKASMDVRLFVKFVTRQGQDVTPSDF
jgi:hypothetical protein